MSGWWATKVRQFFRHLFGRVSRAERDEAAAWLTPKQAVLFDSMHRADQRHGLDVVQALRAAGHDDPDVLLAGLLHDSAKGRAVGLWHRVGCCSACPVSGVPSRPSTITRRGRPISRWQPAAASVAPNSSGTRPTRPTMRWVWPCTWPTRRAEWRA